MFSVISLLFKKKTLKKTARLRHPVASPALVGIADKKLIDLKQKPSVAYYENEIKG